MNYKLWLIFALLLTSLAFTTSNAQTCDVGELCGDALYKDGPCNDDVETNAEDTCQDYCATLYGEELVASACQNRLNDGNKRECVCQLKCVHAGCWGDPHCGTFDGVVNWSYQGLCKHYLIKPIKKYESLPQFQVLQTNRRIVNTPVAVIEKIELYVPEWRQKVELEANFLNGTCVLTVNGQQIDGQRVLFSEKDDYKNSYITVLAKTPTNIVVETSFGVKITMDAWFAGDCLTSVNVYIPRHPDLKGNSVGLLGRWNDDPNDDFIDADGIKRTPEEWSWEYGDSWCLCQKQVLPKNQQLEIMARHEAQMNIVKNDSRKTKQIQDLCQYLRDPKMLECAKQLNRQLPSLEHCFVDVSYTSDTADGVELVSGLIRSFLDSCDKQNTTAEDHGPLQQAWPVGLETTIPPNEPHFAKKRGTKKHHKG